MSTDPPDRPPLTRRQRLDAERTRKRVWSQLGQRLHQILDLTLKEQRPALEAAHLNGYSLTLFIRVVNPEDVLPPPAPEPEPEPAPRLIVEAP